jgi:hypothetical protein
LLDTSREDVPKVSGLCPQTTRDSLDISLALQPIRQVCFPYIKKEPQTIPQLGSTGKYLVEQVGAFYNWPRIIEKSLAKRSAPITYLTYTDDKDNFKGDHFRQKFIGRFAANKVYRITSNGNNFK